MQLNSLYRNNDLEKINHSTFDIIIIGGGITGAGILLDATSRGLKAILFEAHDFAQGTSSRSTKLIHGGLRYLKQFEFKIVRETGLERAVIHNNAIHLVHPEKMLLPIVKNGTLGKTSASLALWVYDFLAKVQKNEKRRMLNKAETLLIEPLLIGENLLGGGLYYEYRTDDARLTIEVIKTAVEKGATAFNYTEVSGFLYDKSEINGIEIIDKINNKKFNINAKTIINAAGPWVDNVRKLDKPINGKRLHLTKGVHIVVNYSALPLQQSTYFDTEDGRMIFAIPRLDKTYIGTTDTNYIGDLLNPVCTDSDIDYLLKNLHSKFKNCNIKKQDVLSTWAGLRPLIHEDGKNPSELSRKDEIFISESGLISIAGGKLTGYRKMAEKVIDKSLKLRNIKATPSQTKYLKLSGNTFENRNEFLRFITLKCGECKQLHWSESQIVKLAHKYGKNIDLIIDIAFTQNIRNEPLRSIILAEYEYCKNYEGVQNIDDYVIRRSGIKYFEPEIENEVREILIGK